MEFPPEFESEFELLKELPSAKPIGCFLVKDKSSKRLNVLRLLAPEFSDNQGLVEEFHSFFSRFSEISNRSYLPRVYSISGTIGGPIYVLEEYFTGIALPQFIQERYQVPDLRRQVIDIVIRVCEGLHHAHQKDVFHLCIAPEDILIDPNNPSKVKLVGFGSQIFASTGNVDCFSEKNVRCVAPEVLNEGSFDPSSDVYSLASTLAKSFPELSRDTPVKRALSIIPSERHATTREFEHGLKQNEWSGSGPPGRVDFEPSLGTGGLQPLVTLRIEPFDATVRLNGKLLGIAGARGLAIPWRYGSTVTIEKPGYETKTVTLESPPDGPEISVKLQTTNLLTTYVPSWANYLKTFPWSEVFSPFIRDPVRRATVAVGLLILVGILAAALFTVRNKRESTELQLTQLKQVEQEKLKVERELEKQRAVERERVEQEKQRLAKEIQEKESLESERRRYEKELARLRQVKEEKLKVERELERQRDAERERLEQERLKLEKERQERERLEKERLQRERQEQERLAEEVRRRLEQEAARRRQIEEERLKEAQRERERQWTAERERAQRIVQEKEKWRSSLKKLSEYIANAKDKMKGSRYGVVAANLETGKFGWAVRSSVSEAVKWVLNECQKQGISCEEFFYLAIHNETTEEIKVYLFHPSETNFDSNNHLWFWTVTPGKRTSFSIDTGRLLVSKRFFLSAESKSGIWRCKRLEDRNYDVKSFSDGQQLMVTFSDN
jgi:serine/threonine protein kinase